MKSFYQALNLIFVMLPLAIARASTITTAAELFSQTYSDNVGKGRPFSLTATVTLPCCERKHQTMAIEDATGAMLVTLNRANLDFSPQRGDCLSLNGLIAADAYGHPCAACTSACLVACAERPPAAHRDPENLTSSAYRFRTVEINGTIADAFLDEIDPNYMFAILDTVRHKRVIVATEADGRTSDNCVEMIGKTVCVLGIYRPIMYGSRTHFGPNIRTTPENIRIDATRFSDPFKAPELNEPRLLCPDEIISTERRTIRGKVIARWPTNRALIRTHQGKTVRICVAHGTPPEQGEVIEASGFPETDLYRINLSRCLWRAAACQMPDDESVEDISVAQLTHDRSGRRQYDTNYHGRRIRLRGRLIGFVPREGDLEKALLECDGQHIPVYIGAHHGVSAEIPVNSIVEIDGTCVMDAESWSPYTFFPRIQEILVSVAGPSHIRVVSKPSWWTPARLSAVCAGLIALLLWFAFWNRMLNRAISIKGKELKQEITARLTSNLKTRERTRLAVELHDSLAQTISGAAMEIGSAIRCADAAPNEMMSHLQTASQTLQSCRDDLRDCLWDLRSNALEVNSMDEAIRTTLRPIIGDLEPVIRFNVIRSRLSDNTAHAILRIIHELVSNAIRHGHARTIRIAGILENRRLRFSVRDDGRGFDLQRHPNANEGHFGLEGIRERIRPFNGEMDIESSPTAGTRVSIALDVNLPEEEDLIEI